MRNPAADLQAVRAQRRQLREQRQAILNTARKAKRDELSPAEERDFSRLDREDRQAREREEALEADFDRYLNTSIGVIAGRQDTDDTDMPGMLGAGDRRMRETFSHDARALKPDETFEGRVRARASVDPTAQEDFDLGDAIRAKVFGPRTDRERRAQSALSDTAGGFLLTDSLSARIIDRLRPVNQFMAAGAGVVELTTWDTYYARVSGDATATAHAENDTIATSTVNFDRIKVEPKTITCLVQPLSEELMTGAPNAGEALTANIGQAMAQEIDRQSLYGAGGLEMIGLANLPGTLSLPLGGADGGAVSWYDTILDARGALLAANAGDPKAVILSVREEIKRSKQKDGDGLPLPIPPAIAGVRYLPTTKVSIAETYGATTTASRMFTGDFSTMALAFMTQVKCRVLTERYADKLAYGIVCHALVDLLAYQPARMCQVVGINGA